MPLASSADLPVALLSLLAEGRPTHRIAAACRGGLILVGRYYNDLILPGSGLMAPAGFDCRSIEPIGEVKLEVLAGKNALASARKCRLKDVEQLQRIVHLPEKQMRAALLLTLLCRYFGLAAVKPLPAYRIARLVAVDPDGIVAAWQQYEAGLKRLAGTSRLSDQAYLAWQRQLYHLSEADRTKPALPLPLLTSNSGC
jgi:hypothetical protein